MVSRYLWAAELNILDFEGHVDLDEYYLKKIDYAVASLHTPCIDNNGSVADYTRAYLNVLENPYVNITDTRMTPGCLLTGPKWLKQLPETTNYWK